jgi:glycogen synthase
LNGYAHATLPWSAPVVVVAHSCVGTWWRAVRAEPLPPRFGKYHEAVSAGLAAARVIVAPTAAMLRALSEEYEEVSTERACVIPNGMTPQEPGPLATTVPKEPLILTAARLWDEAKNVAALCDIAPELSWPVLVAGDSRAPGAAEPVHLPLRTLGRLPARELANWYARAAIYALPARYEPFGLSVLEAAAAGCALVLGDIPSLRELWDGAAVFVPPDDRRALAARIQALVADPAARLALTTRARLRASTLTIERSADHYIGLYERVAA